MGRHTIFHDACSSLSWFNSRQVVLSVFPHKLCSWVSEIRFLIKIHFYEKLFIFLFLILSPLLKLESRSSKKVWIPPEADRTFCTFYSACSTKITNISIESQAGTATDEEGWKTEFDFCWGVCFIYNLHFQTNYAL